MDKIYQTIKAYFKMINAATYPQMLIIGKEDT